MTYQTAIYYRPGSRLRKQAHQPKIITLPEIIRTLDTRNPFDARCELYKSHNATLALSGTILKIERRSGFGIFIEVATALPSRKMEAFCEFDETEIEKAKEAKIKKGSKVSLIGSFQTAYEKVIVLYGCRLKVDKVAPKKDRQEEK